jgi:hypothetical protein
VSKTKASGWFLLGALKVAALGLIAGLMMLAPQSSADANIALARQFNKGCSYCHVPLQEPRLNPTGTRFQRCGYRFDCEYAPQPQYRPQSANMCGSLRCNRGVCHFRVFGAGGTHEFTIMAGESRRVTRLNISSRWCQVLPNGQCDMRPFGSLNPC